MDLKFDWTIDRIGLNLDASKKSFRRYLENLGIRESTIDGYVGNIGRYLVWTGTDRPTIQDASRFRDSLIDRRLHRSSINQYSYAIQHYHKMLGEPVHFHRLNPNNFIPYYFTSDEVLKIFGACNNLKHYAILSTLFYGALRASELCGLDDSDLRLEDLSLRIKTGKGGKEGIVYIQNECASVLKQYLRVRPVLEIDGHTPLFYTDFGRRWDRTELYRMFVDYKKKAGIQKQGGVHVFGRHTPATIMIANGCDIRVVQEVLRHREAVCH